MSRQDRVAEAIKKEASLIIHDDLNDPRLGFVTITDVKLSGDLRNATIFFSVLGKEEDHQKTQEALDSALGFIRKEISERINLKFAPDIIFREDRSSEYSVRIEEVLNELKETEKKGDSIEPKKSSRKPKKAR